MSTPAHQLGPSPAITRHLSSLSSASASSSPFKSFIMAMLSILCLGRLKAIRAIPASFSVLKYADAIFFSSGLVENVIYLAVRQAVGFGLHLHAYHYFLFRHV